MTRYRPNAYKPLREPKGRPCSASGIPPPRDCDTIDERASTWSLWRLWCAALLSKMSRSSAERRRRCVLRRPILVRKLAMQTCSCSAACIVSSKARGLCIRGSDVCAVELSQPTHLVDERDARAFFSQCTCQRGACPCVCAYKLRV
jgi:hypothetical protein